MQETHLIKYLAPSWFAVVMGTGGLANIFTLWQNAFGPGRILGILLGSIALILYFLLLLPWFSRWFLFYDYLRRDLHHPVLSNFFVTMPVATAIIGTNVHTIWRDFLPFSLVYPITMLTYLIAIVGVTFFTFYTTFRIITNEAEPKPETMNFAWIMAPIANMAVLLIGNPVLSMAIQTHSAWTLSIFTANLALMGIGFFLFVFISAVIFVRLIAYPLPPAELTPSFGIFLSAVGLAVIGLLGLAENAVQMGILSSVDLSALLAGGIWGFGLWIVGIILLISLFQIRRGGIPFSLGWWAYIFPLAAYTIASLRITQIYPSPWVTGYTVFLTLLLSGLWLVTFYRTGIRAIRGNLFRGTPIMKESTPTQIK